MLFPTPCRNFGKLARKTIIFGACAGGFQTGIQLPLCDAVLTSEAYYDSKLPKKIPFI